MKRSGPKIPFMLICIGALIAAYVIGLGIRRIRFAGAPSQARGGAESEKPAEEPSKAKDIVAAVPGTPKVIPAESQEMASAEEEAPSSSDTAQETRAQLTIVSRQEPEAVREGRPQRSPQEIWSQLSEEDKTQLREEMQGLMSKRSEMTSEEMKKAQAEIHEKYGLPSPQ